MQLDGRTAIVTDSGSWIGAALACGSRVALGLTYRLDEWRSSTAPCVTATAASGAASKDRNAAGRAGAVYRPTVLQVGGRLMLTAVPRSWSDTSSAAHAGVSE